MDHQTYYKAIRVDQGELASVVLDRLLAAWWQEAWLLGIVSGDEVPAHQWFWDGAEHVDPLKEAQAQAVRLANATTTLAAEYGRMGRDWETELKQRALEVAMMNELGLPIPGAVTDIGPSEEAEEGFEKALRNVVIDGFGGRKDADA
jgi:capsid protein